MQRVFIGIPLDRSAQVQIDELLSPIKDSHRDIRWVPENNRHLTLAFLGNRPAEVVESIVGTMDQAYKKETSFKTPTSSLMRFPNSRGNILALVLKADAHLARLYRVTQELLVANGFEFSRTQFRPHITLGRLKRARQLKFNLNQKTNICLQVSKIAFYQSTLTQSGSIYLALKETGLQRSE